jgi:hypothetical protein
LRAYHIASIAVAVERPVKWVDNLLSHHAIDGVSAGGRGVTRRVTLEGAVRIAVVSALTGQLGVPVDRAVALATQLATGQGQAVVGSGLALRLDIDALRAHIEMALADVAEHSVPARRGRPPRKRSGALE